MSPASALTDASGQASTSWTLGTATGANSLSASVGAVGPLQFSATGTAGSPATLGISAGGGQSAPAGSAVPIAPAVVVRDANNNPVAAATVTFAVTSGGGALAGATATSNAQGIATVGSWTLGPAAGLNTLTASLGSLTPVTFTATALPGAAASIVVAAGGTQNGVVGTAVATRPAALVRDGNGNPVAGVSVTFNVTAGGGNITGATAVTNAQGVATVGSWTLGTVAGTNNLSATLPPFAPIGFLAVAQPGPAASVVIVAGNNQGAPTLLPVLVNPLVEVRDAFGNPVPNAPVTFSVTSGGGVSNPGAVVTGANGRASTIWTLGAVNMYNSLAASSGTAPAAVFTAKATWEITRYTTSSVGPYTVATVWAEDGINGGSGPNWGTPPGRPSLSVACFDNSRNILVQLFAPTLISNSGAVAYSFDNGSAIGEIWDELPPNYRSLFSPTQASSLAFLVNLAPAQTFKAAFAQFPGSPIWLPLFVVSGFNRISGTVVGACL